jgi:FG-GAP repeat/FG-GAP-like repeat/FlgD Ig-like domain
MNRLCVLALLVGTLCCVITEPEPALADLIPSEAWSKEGGQDYARLGNVTTVGDANGDGYDDILVSSALYDNGQLDEGKVWLYVGSEIASLSEAWSVEGDVVNMRLGDVVAAAGDVNGDGYDDAVVATPYYPNGIYQPHEGAVWVYHGTPSGLSTTANWMKVGEAVNIGFGAAAATAGDVNGDGYDDIIVSTSGWSNGQTAEGKVELYLGSSGGLSTSPASTLEANLAGSAFGLAISPAGDVNADGYDDILVGAPYFSFGNGGTNGMAFVYLGSATGLSLTPLWAIAGKDPTVGEFWPKFGFTAGCAGDVNGDGYADILFGAEAAYAPVAYLYHGGPAGPDTVADWTLVPDYPMNDLASQLFTAGDVNSDGYSDVLVADPWWPLPGINAGCIMLYRGGKLGLESQNRQVVQGQGGGGLFGTSARPAGDVNGDGYGDVVVSCPQWTSGQTQEGKIYVFRGRVDGPSNSVWWRRELNQANAAFGGAIAIGDWNGDTFDDVAASAPAWDAAQLNEGRVVVYNGSVNGPSLATSWSATGAQPLAAFGNDVANAGDVNGDGYEDLIVGSPGFKVGEDFVGRAYLFLGGANGLEALPAWTRDGSFPGEQFGWKVDSAGDVNGDGYGDVLVGTPYLDLVGYTDIGAAYLYLGSQFGLGAVSAWSDVGSQVGEQMGSSVACAGDVNADGLSDFAIGAVGRTVDDENEGAVYIYYGAADISSEPSLVLHENKSGSKYGLSVACAGDVNGDGYSDIAIGAPFYTQTLPEQGALFAYFGGPSGLGTDYAHWSLGVEAYDQYGTAVAGTDANGDGRGDIAVGAPYADTITPEGGTVRIWTRYVGGGWVIYSFLRGSQINGGFGTSLGGRGDVDGDQFSDIAIGAPTYNQPESDEGALFLFPGQPTSGIDRSVQQERVEGPTLLALLNASDEDDQFQLRARLRTPLGRGRVRFQYDVAPVGTIFPGPIGVTTAIWRDTGVPVPGQGSRLTFRRTVSGLTPETAYHWRARYHFDSPYFGRSRWMSLTRDSAHETDLRTASSVVAVSSSSAPDRSFALSAWPNPSSDRMQIRFDLPRRAKTVVSVYDVQGRKVVSLIDDEIDAGPHSAAWDGRTTSGSRAAAGTYFLRLQTGDREQSVKLVRIE